MFINDLSLVIYSSIYLKQAVRVATICSRPLLSP